MKYELLNHSKNDIHNIENVIFENRGIKDCKHYMNLSDYDLYDYTLLDHINEAVECLDKHIQNKDHIHIIVDSDVDGYTSSACLYQYLRNMDDMQCEITYSLHTGKQHGISKDIIIPENTKLLFIPDSGTNDIEQCKILKNQNIDIIILDHHIADNPNPYAIIVNNQCCNYPNKDLSGVGIVYKFLQACDDYFWIEKADNYLDLVAVGNIADAMDIRSYETRRLIDKGIHNINNKFLQAMFQKQSFSLGNQITAIGIAFYIVPLINSLIRVGNEEEKDILFRALTEQYDEFDYKKRGTSGIINENIYDRAVRYCVNAKGKQTREKEKSISAIIDDIQKHKYNYNKIIIDNVTKTLDSKLTGLTAMSIANYYGKPCLLLRKTIGKPNVYSGSGRNINNSPIEDLRQFLLNTGYFNYVTGHPSAFGTEIDKDNIPKAIQCINEKLKDTDMSKKYLVDFIIDSEDLTVDVIHRIDGLKKYYGNCFEEPYIVVKNLILNKDTIILMGKEQNSWKYIFNDDIAIVKFKCSQDDKILKWINNSDEKSLVINLIGKASMNEYKSILTPQLIVEDYSIIEGE